MPHSLIQTYPQHRAQKACGNKEKNEYTSTTSVDT